MTDQERGTKFYAQLMQNAWSVALQYGVGDIHADIPGAGNALGIAMKTLDIKEVMLVPGSMVTVKTNSGYVPTAFIPGALP